MVITLGLRLIRQAANTPGSPTHFLNGGTSL